MFTAFLRLKARLAFRVGGSFFVSIITFSLVFIPIPARADGMGFLNLPQPGAMLSTSPRFVPVLLKGLVVHPDKPLQFEFIIDSGNSAFDQEQVKQESERLIKYFLASLTVPENDLWVNLSPYERDRMVPDELGKTELGRDLLAQDYVLKQLTASMIYPEKDLGKEFWARVYKKAQEQYGTTEIPVNTFNKVWILPDTATVFEKDNAAYVVESKLKVMLDRDYLALTKNASEEALASTGVSNEEAKDVNDVSSDIVREIVLPEIAKEVNEGKNFAPLRQIYHSLILAKWYKQAIQESLFAKVYFDKNKTVGVDTDDQTIKDQIYAQYIAAYKKGVFNYIKEDIDSATQEAIPRKYFSGGIERLMSVQLTRTSNTGVISTPTGNLFREIVNAQPMNAPLRNDFAMLSDEERSPGLFSLLLSRNAWKKSSLKVIGSAFAVMGMCIGCNNHSTGGKEDRQELNSQLTAIKPDLFSYSPAKKTTLTTNELALILKALSLQDESLDLHAIWLLKDIENLPPETVSSLIRRFNSTTDEDLRYVIIEALGHSKDKRALDLLINQARFDTMQINRLAQGALTNVVDDTTLPDVLEYLKSDDVLAREAAARPLNHPRFARPATVSALIDSLTTFFDLAQKYDDRPARPLNERTRPVYIVSALGAYGSAARETLPRLIQILEKIDSFPDRFNMALANTIANVGGVEAVPELLRILKSSPNTEARRGAYYALVGIGSPAVPALVDALTVSKDMNIISLLGDIKDPQAIAPLIQAFNSAGASDYNLQDVIAINLVKFGADAVLPLIENLKQERNPLIIKSLGEIGDARAVPVLLEILKDRDKILDSGKLNTEVDVTVNALLKFKSPSLITPFIEVLQDRKVENSGPLEPQRTIIDALGTMWPDSQSAVSTIIDRFKEGHSNAGNWIFGKDPVINVRAMEAVLAGMRKTSPQFSYLKSRMVEALPEKDFLTYSRDLSEQNRDALELIYYTKIAGHPYSFADTGRVRGLNKFFEYSARSQGYPSIFDIFDAQRVREILTRIDKTAPDPDILKKDFQAAVAEDRNGTFVEQSFYRGISHLRTIALARHSTIGKLFLQEGDIAYPKEETFVFYFGYDGNKPSQPAKVEFPAVHWSEDDLPVLKELLNSKYEFYRTAAQKALKRAPDFQEVEVSKEIRDRAALSIPEDTMPVQHVIEQKNVGGIDFNQLTIDRTGSPVTVRFDPDELNQLMDENFGGFMPEIIEISPISNPLPLLGINQDTERKIAAKM